MERTTGTDDRINTTDVAWAAGVPPTEMEPRTSEPTVIGDGMTEAKKEVRNAAGGVASTVKDHAEKAKEEVKGATSEIACTVKDQAAKAREVVTSTTQEALDKAKTQGSQLFQKQRDLLVDELASCSKAMKQAATKLHEERETAIAPYVEALATGLERAQEGLRNKQVGEITSGIESFARRNPSVFFAAALVGGMGIARFLKASRPEQS